MLALWCVNLSAQSWISLWSQILPLKKTQYSWRNCIYLRPTGAVLFYVSASFYQCGLFPQFRSIFSIVYWFSSIELSHMKWLTIDDGNNGFVGLSIHVYNIDSGVFLQLKESEKEHLNDKFHFWRLYVFQVMTRNGCSFCCNPRG